MRSNMLVALALAATLVVACGGGDDAPPTMIDPDASTSPPPPPVPPPPGSEGRVMISAPLTGGMVQTRHVAEGAQVIDRGILDHMPMEFTLPAGRHTFTVVLAGYVATVHSVDVGPDTSNDVFVAMCPDVDGIVFACGMEPVSRRASVHLNNEDNVCYIDNLFSSTSTIMQGDAGETTSGGGRVQFTTDHKSITLNWTDGLGVDRTDTCLTD